MNRSLAVCAVLFGLATAACASDPAPPPEPPAVFDRVQEFAVESEVFGNARRIGVLTPPGYAAPEAADRLYPVVYLLDGRSGFAPDGWNAAAAADAFWAAGGTPFILVGVSNGGATSTTTDPQVDRASEFLHAADPMWEDYPRPEPKGDRFPAFLLDELHPAVASGFRVDPDRGVIVAGGSYAAIAALTTARMRPEAVEALLLESPSMQVDPDGAYAGAAAAGPPLARVYVGVGGAEQITVRGNRWAANAAEELADAFAGAGVETCFGYEPTGEHRTSEWAARLPDALAFVMDGRRQGYCAAE
jgi:predicted alpha/beta superfamily hydrolase